jgi:hypothetical protein
MKGYSRVAREAGPWGVSAIAVAVALAALAVALVGLPEAGVNPTPTLPREEINIVPATGVEGFNVEGFCEDPATAVTGFLAPDTTGAGYQLLRERDGVPESVTVILNSAGEAVVATHYYQTSAGQRDEAAFLTPAALECIQERSRL